MSTAFENGESVWHPKYGWGYVTFDRVDPNGCPMTGRFRFCREESHAMIGFGAHGTFLVYDTFPVTTFDNIHLSTFIRRHAAPAEAGPPPSLTSLEKGSNIRVFSDICAELLAAKERIRTMQEAFGRMKDAMEDQAESVDDFVCGGNHSTRRVVT